VFLGNVDAFPWLCFFFYYIGKSSKNPQFQSDFSPATQAAALKFRSENAEILNCAVIGRNPEGNWRLLFKLHRCRKTSESIFGGRAMTARIILILAIVCLFLAGYIAW